MNKISNQKGLRQRSFEIIRKPDLIDSSFLFNNVQVAYVATCPETNISFYANNGQGGVIGVSVYPDGRKVLKNATSKNNGNKYCHSNDDYLQFKNAFGQGKHILASHAVYIAWRNKEIPAGMTIDHIDGCTTNNDFRNLRCVSNAINSRDGGFLRKLRNQGINPPEIRRSYLLRYFDRMAFIKENIPRHRYKHLDRADLMTILFYDLPVIYAHFEKQYHLTLPFKLGLL
ncbi:MAG: HNH endonuclease [Paludibacteraceae bacterium]|nr:HNH endonuclease [Paludibacteraceae bacterium]